MTILNTGDVITTRSLVYRLHSCSFHNLVKKQLNYKSCEVVFILTINAGFRPGTSDNYSPVRNASITASIHIQSTDSTINKTWQLRHGGLYCFLMLTLQHPSPSRAPPPNNNQHAFTPHTHQHPRYYTHSRSFQWKQCRLKEWFKKAR